MLEPPTPHLIPVGRCAPPVGWVRLVPRLPRWKGSADGPARLQLTDEVLSLIDKTQRKVQRELTYSTDSRTYGVADRWEVPDVTIKIKIGDCEDFAFYKAAELIRAGIPSSCLHLLICWIPKTSRNKREAHAVLAVATDAGTKIMDNRYPLPLSDNKLENIGVYDARRLSYEWLAWSIPGEWFWWERVR